MIGWQRQLRLLTFLTIDSRRKWFAAFRPQCWTFWSPVDNGIDWLCVVTSITVVVGDWGSSIVAFIVVDWRISILISQTRNVSMHQGSIWYRLPAVPTLFRMNSNVKSVLPCGCASVDHGQ